MASLLTDLIQLYICEETLVAKSDEHQGCYINQTKNPLDSSGFNA